MTEAKEETDFSDSIPFRPERVVSPVFATLVSWLAEETANYHKLTNVRPSTRTELTEAMNCVFANLMAAISYSETGFIAISRAESTYKKTRYLNIPFAYTNLIRVLDFLAGGENPWVEFKRGFQDRRGSKTIGKTSRYRFSENARIAIVEYAEAASKYANYPKITPVQILSIALRAGVEKIAEKVSIGFSTNPTRFRASADVIRLKSANGDLIEYADTRETNEMRQKLTAWNTFISDEHHVDLLVTENELSHLYDKSDAGELKADAFYGDEKDRPRFVELDRVKLHRVFNNGSLQQGGRFYGGWWQRIPSHYRRYITINGRATREFDYSNLHAAMLYARISEPLADDAYSLPNVPSQYRKLIKSTFFKLINAGEGQRIEPPNPTTLPPGISWAALQNAIIEKHAPISQFLRSGIGLSLQRTDSDIAEEVMLRMMAQDILVLPVHDSFVTYHFLQDKIQEEMSRAYRAAMRNEIGIDADTSFVEEWNEQADLPVEFDADDVILNVKARPGFERYQMRADQFFKSRDCAWYQRFGVPPI
jgi:hypothetical protein